LTTDFHHLSGIIVLFKPQGETSRTTLNRLQRAVKTYFYSELNQNNSAFRIPNSELSIPRVGHAGTLDPLADGVLIACVGKATKLIETVQMLHKRYIAAFRLGAVSDTEDAEGTIRELPNPPKPAFHELLQAAAKFVGKILQRPPIFSALKVNGKRSYHLARQGIAAELSPREITIDAIEILEYDYPIFRVAVTCGSGTYIRSLGRDIGEQAGSGALMISLTRESIGNFRIENAVPPQIFDDSNSNRWLEYLLPIETSVQHLPRINLSPNVLQKIRYGQLVTQNEIDIPAPLSESAKNIFAAFSPEEKLAAILEIDGEKMKIKQI
jgi:tRNA pseudouridine55 synthase